MKAIIQKLVNSFVYSIQGLWYVIRNELSFQLELFFVILAVILALVLQITTGQWLVLMFSASILLISELINTAGELLCDHIAGDHYNRVIGTVKDILSGTVLLCIINFMVVSAIIIVIPLVKRVIALATGA